MRCALRVLAMLAAGAGPALEADVRVQDIVRLQGQRTNKLMGYGLVVGLNGTGDGDKNLPTLRALMAMHSKFQQPVLDPRELKGNGSVALVAVEATISEFGANEGQSIDVIVSVIGTAESLAGGQLLTTPLQSPTMHEHDPASQTIYALAGGRVEIPVRESPTRGIVRRGATLEHTFYYNFIEGGAITLVLDDTHTGWQWAHWVARAINSETSNRAALETAARAAGGRVVVEEDVAYAMNPKFVHVKIPEYELADPANFITRVLQTPLFMLPEQAARVWINRTTKDISFTDAVKVSPTILSLPGLGTVLIGAREPAPATETQPIEAPRPAPRAGLEDAIPFRDVLSILNRVKATPEQLIQAVEHLHRTGTLHAQLQYVED
jgi:flagellar P-ring protein precursor FlgI